MTTSGYAKLTTFFKLNSLTRLIINAGIEKVQSLYLRFTYPLPFIYIPNELTIMHAKDRAEWRLSCRKPDLRLRNVKFGMQPANH